jgi:adenylate cyclase
MSTIHSLPDGLRVPIEPGQTLLAALKDADVPIVHACGGQARCSTCRVRVVAGLEACTPRTEDEQRMATRIGLEDAIRLACQTRVGTDVTVRRLVLDPEDTELTRQFTSRSAGTSMGREAHVAILFADVEGFTQLAEVLPAYDVVHVLHRWFHQAAGVIEAHGGRVDNYMGDGLLAVFHLPAEQASRAAVGAGLGLLEVATRMGAYFRTAYDRAFAVRVGVHCGSVVVGSPTPWHREHDTVIGDVVNLASRIEAANKGLDTRLLVSDNVFRRVAPHVRAGRRADLEIRGKSGVHGVIEVLGLISP